MEIKERDISLRFEFGQKGELCVEWCDGLTRGLRMLEVEEDFRENVRNALLGALQAEKYSCRCAVREGHIAVEAALRMGVYCVEMAYVPDDDLLPWQWVRCSELFRRPEYEAFIQTV